MISTSNNPVSHGSDLLKIGIPKRIGRNYIGYIVLDEQVKVIPRFLINLAFLYFAYSPVGYNFSYWNLFQTLFVIFHSIDESKE